jgi:hypothetical protein
MCGGNWNVKSELWTWIFTILIVWYKRLEQNRSKNANCCFLGSTWIPILQHINEKHVDHEYNLPFSDGFEVIINQPTWPNTKVGHLDSYEIISFLSHSLIWNKFRPIYFSKQAQSVKTNSFKNNETHNFSTNCFNGTGMWKISYIIISLKKIGILIYLKKIIAYLHI